MAGGGTHDIAPYLGAIQGIREKGAPAALTYKTLDIQCVSSKFSNTKIPIYKLVIDSTPISRNNNLIVTYTCLNCSTNQEITLNLFTRKINKGSTYCGLCKNQGDEKRAQHATFMRENFGRIAAGEYAVAAQPKKGRTLAEHLEMSAADWTADEPEFKEAYELRHLSADEFAAIRPKITGVNNKKLVDLSKWEYIPNYRVFNQSRYTPMLINRADGLVEKPLYVSFACDNCGVEHVHRDLEIVKNKMKVLCRDCTLTNRTFRLRRTELADGTSIMWQSVPERRFIDWCQANGIKVKNGPRLRIGGGLHEYRVDFELPELSMLIEIKDNHCWHKQQVLTGKHAAKEAAANEWCTTNNYEYKIIFPKTNATIREYILNKSCKI